MKQYNSINNLPVFNELKEMMTRIRDNVIAPMQLELAQLNKQLAEELSKLEETNKPCNIFDYDGAIMCLAHNRKWGVISNPDEPCVGFTSQTAGNEASTRPSTGLDGSDAGEASGGA